MKVIYTASISLCLVIICAILAISLKKDPQQLLIGRWEEVSWQYEKIDQNAPLSHDINAGQFSEIYPDIKMHEAEFWMFDDNRFLNLQRKNGEAEMLTWNIKGMGNILELKHGNKVLEKYKLNEISDDSLVLHFSFDLQVRGIVKMVFKKVKETDYAKKI